MREALASDRRATIELSSRSAEAAEAQIDAFIERRTRERIRDEELTASQEAATWREDLWKASVRRYHKRRRRQNVAAWFAYFCQQADAHRKLSESYEARAEALCQDEPKGAA